MNSLAVQYAFRNLLRYKRRSLLTIGTVALSTLVTIVGFQYADAVLAVWQQGAIDHGAGHAQVHLKAFFDKPDVISRETLMDENNPVDSLLVNDPSVLGVAKRLIFEGIISLGKKTMYFQGRGIQAQQEAIVSPGIFSQDIMSGNFIESQTMSGITIGKGLAEALGAKVGDEVTLMTNTLGGSVNGIDLLVTGIIDFPVPTISKRLLYMNIEAAQKALAVDHRYSELAIRLKDGIDAQVWLDSFSKDTRYTSYSPLYDIRGWWRIEPLIRKVEDIWHSIMGIIILLLFSTAAVSILNIVYLLVAERTIEIGTLMSLGAKPIHISILFALEAMGIGMIGSLIGATFAYFVIFFLGFFGVPFDSPFASGIFMIYPQNDFVFTFFVFTIGVLICLFSALLPARKASKIPPIAAFRGQIT